MILSADQVIAAITWLVPGFVALKILYTFGFRSKRSDLEWAIWSLLGSAAIAPITPLVADQLGWSKSAATFADTVKGCAAPILTGPEADRLTGVVACASTALTKQVDTTNLIIIGVVLGAILGVILVVGWRVLDRYIPWVGAKGIPTTWDRVVDRKIVAWVEVLISDGRRISGKLARVATDVETETPDVFLTKPAWVDASGSRTPFGDVQGVWLPRSEIKLMVIVADVQPPAPAAEPASSPPTATPPAEDREAAATAV